MSCGVWGDFKNKLDDDDDQNREIEKTPSTKKMDRTQSASRFHAPTARAARSHPTGGDASTGAPLLLLGCSPAGPLGRWSSVPPPTAGAASPVAGASSSSVAAPAQSSRAGRRTTAKPRAPSDVTRTKAPGWPKAVEPTALQVSRSSTRGRGWLLSG